MTSSWLKTFIDKLGRSGASSPVEGAAVFKQVISPDLDLWHWLVASRAEANERGLKMSALEIGGAGDYDLFEHEPDGHPAQFELRVIKVQAERQLRFFSQSALVDLARREPRQIEMATSALVAGLKTPSRTHGLDVSPWDDEASDPPLYDSAASPRQFVTNLSAEAMVPERATSWIFEGKPDGDFAALLSPIACRQLAIALADQVHRGASGEPVCVYRGARRHQTELPEAGDAIWLKSSLQGALQLAAEWTYWDASDVEVRHALLNAEIARCWGKSDSWADGVDQVITVALESAKTAYRLHLSGKSAEALKLMSDLRKSLADDVKAVGAQTSTLSSNLWRDAAVAFAAYVFKPASGSTLEWLPLAAAAYLAISCYIGQTVAGRAVRAIEQNEKTFREKIYNPLISSDDYSTIAKGGYDISIRDFRWVSDRVLDIYVIVIILLIGPYVGFEITKVIRDIVALASRSFGG